MHAYLAGFRAGQAGVSYDRAVLNVATDPDRCLHVDEQIAYAQLLPATWWAAFNRGHTAGAATHLPADEEVTP